MNDLKNLKLKIIHFTGRISICIRIKDFKGITPSGTTRIETSPYFEGYNVKYSIQVQGRFKENNLTADDIDFGLKIFQHPLAYNPLIYIMNKINLYEEQIFKDDKWLPSWPSSNGEHIEEDNETNRKQFQIKDNQIWYFDFSNSVTDFNDLTVKLGDLQHWEGQPVRYVCKTRDSSIVSFIVSFKLVLIKEESNEIQKPAQGSIAADGA
ncbi:20747_t:CDS:2, partial [Rhizophagus irregularis]